MKTYVSPSVKTMNAFAFETVCAASGRLCQRGGLSKVDPYNTTCQAHMKEAYPNINNSSPFPDDIAQAIIGFFTEYDHAKGLCPEGYDLNGYVG